MDDLDRALAELPRHDASEWSIQEILRQVHEEPSSGPMPGDEPALAPPPQRVPRWMLVAAVVVLGGAAFALSQRTQAPPAPVSPSPALTLKGAGTDSVDPTISLGLSLLRDDVPVALVPGAAARDTDTVLLRYTTDSEGFAYLFRVGPDNDLEVFHGTPTLPGTHHVTVDGRIVGYELNGLSGEHRFGMAFSREPWAPSAHDGAARAPEGLVVALSGEGAFPRRVGSVTVDLHPVRLESPAP